MKNHLLHALSHRANKVWKQYRYYITSRTRSEKLERSTSQSWRDQFFSKIIIFAFPTGIVALVLSIFIELTQQQHLTIVNDLMAFSIVGLITLNRHVSIENKKRTGMCILMVFATFKIISLNSLMIGSVFLLLFSLFSVLLFSKKMGYISVLINATIFLSVIFTSNPHTEGHQIHFMGYKLYSKWLLFLLNFIFVDLILVMVIIHIIESFEKTISRAEMLSEKLKLEVLGKTKNEKRLQEALTYYKSLFFFNPLPILIYDPINLSLKYVNKSALIGYGYSKKEFLQMTINELPRCGAEVFKERIGSDFAKQKSEHFQKNGNRMDVEVYTSSIKFNDTWASLAIVRNISDEVAFLNALELQHEKMREIAYLQSHVIRNPLSKILGIAKLMQHETNSNNDFAQYLNYLLASAEELDSLVAGIVNKTKEG